MNINSNTLDADLAVLELAIEEFANSSSDTLAFSEPPFLRGVSATLGMAIRKCRMSLDTIRIWETCMRDTCPFGVEIEPPPDLIQKYDTLRGKVIAQLDTLIRNEARGKMMKNHVLFSLVNEAASVASKPFTWYKDPSINPECIVYDPTKILT